MADTFGNAAAEAVLLTVLLIFLLIAFFAVLLSVLPGVLLEEDSSSVVVVWSGRGTGGGIPWGVIIGLTMGMKVEATDVSASE